MEEQQKSKFGKGVVVGVILTLVVVLGGFGLVKGVTHFYHLGQPDIVQAGVSHEAEKKIELLGNLIDQIYLYADDVDPENLLDGMLKGYVAALGDPYTVYYNEEETTELFQSTSGEYSGIGAVLSQDIHTKVIVVTNVYEGSPAEAGGLQNGDIIYQVNDRVLEGEELSEIVNDIHGEKGTEVVLHVYRGENLEEVECSIIRDVIEARTVEHEMLDNGIGYLKITEFDNVTLDQFNEHFAALQEEGMQGMVVDLRSNPGGSLQTTVDILKSILPEGVIVSTKDRDGSTEEFTNEEDHTFDKPLVVLVNEYTASAAEIFSGAVKDYGIGTIVGTTTFGKGIVQHILELGDGTSLKVTASEYFTPSGENIHGIGITPDVEVELPLDISQLDSDIQLDEAVRIIEEQLK